MLKIDGYNVMLTRGDSVRFMIRLLERELPEGTKAVFTVKDTPWEPCMPVIEKTLDVAGGMVSIILEPYDTDITPGHYVWDLRVKEAAEDGVHVITPMEYAAFVVKEAIGE